MRIARSILLLLSALGCACDLGAAKVYHEQKMLMGTTFEIQVVARNKAAAEAGLEAAFAEIARVEELLSEWRESSEISEVNRKAGVEPVEVGPDLYKVVERSIEISELTDGAFDVTFAVCGGLWSFGEPRVPSAEALTACLDGVGYGRIRLDATRSTLFLPRPEMRIGIAGIGKGYGVDRAADLLEARGFTAYIVDGGGDIRLLGAKPDGPWRVGIRHPRQPEKLHAKLTANGGAVVSSGDYFQFFEKDGVRYHHILDPTTGRPARRAVAVTVVAPNAMDADSLATGMFVLGPERGLALAERLDGVEALFFGPDLTVRSSSGFPPIELVP